MSLLFLVLPVTSGLVRIHSLLTLLLIASERVEKVSKKKKSFDNTFLDIYFCLFNLHTI